MIFAPPPFFLNLFFWGMPPPACRLLRLRVKQKYYANINRIFAWTKFNNSTMTTPVEKMMIGCANKTFSENGPFNGNIKLMTWWTKQKQNISQHGSKTLLRRCNVKVHWTQELDDLSLPDTPALMIQLNVTDKTNNRQLSICSARVTWILQFLCYTWTQNLILCIPSTKNCNTLPSETQDFFSSKT